MSTEEAMSATLRNLETDLGLPEGFCEGLRNEDDWSFVIKLHALFEAAVTRLLVANLRQDALLGVFSQLEMGSGKDKGKIAFASALGILTAEEKRFLKLLGELRNDLVHDVSTVTFDLNAHVASRDTKQRRNFVEAVGSFLGEYFDKPEKLAEAVLKFPKLHLWESGLFALALIRIKTESEHTQHEVEKYLRQFGTQMRSYGLNQSDFGMYAGTPHPQAAASGSRPGLHSLTDVTPGSNVKKE